MYQQLKKLLSKSNLLKGLIKKAVLSKYELKDIYNSYLSKSTKPTITPYGFNLVGSSSIHHTAMQKGDFEPEETKLFLEEFSKSDVFIDVGANIGFFTCLARHANKHVLSIEPLQKNLEFLMDNLLANNWADVEVFPVGLSDKSGLATLYGASSTGASLIGSWAGATKIFKRTIPLTTLDTLVGERFNGKQIFIKVDVEGAEYAALKGAINTIKLTPKPTWVVEICLNEYHPDGINPNYEETFKLFWDNGYEVRTADHHNKLITQNDIKKWVALGKCESGTINYKFSKSQNN